MAHSTESPPIRRIPTRSNLRAIRGTRKSITEAGREHCRRIFSSSQFELIEEMRILRYQKMMRRQKRLEELAKTDPEYAKSLDIKECMLEVQGMIMGKLAAEQNHFEGLAVRPGLYIGDLEARMQETEEAIKALQY